MLFLKFGFFVVSLREPLMFYVDYIFNLSRLHMIAENRLGFWSDSLCYCLHCLLGCEIECVINSIQTRVHWGDVVLVSARNTASVFVSEKRNRLRQPNIKWFHRNFVALFTSKKYLKSLCTSWAASYLVLFLGLNSVCLPCWPSKESIRQSSLVFALDTRSLPQAKSVAGIFEVEETKYFQILQAFIVKKNCAWTFLRLSYILWSWCMESSY